MGKIYEGNLVAKGLKFAVVVSRFNDFITSRLLEGCKDCLQRHEASDNDIDIVRVPGSFEIPYAAARLATLKKYDAVICLGAIIRGDTPHYDYIAAEVAKGIATAGLSAGIPVVFGVLTTDTLEQAIDRAGAKAGNKGAEAALSAIETANLFSLLNKSGK